VQCGATVSSTLECCSNMAAGFICRTAYSRMAYRLAYGFCRMACRLACSFCRIINGLQVGLQVLQNGLQAGLQFLQNGLQVVTAEGPRPRNWRESHSESLTYEPCLTTLSPTGQAPSVGRKTWHLATLQYHRWTNLKPARA
jgi:hypothetical protein